MTAPVLQPGDVFGTENPMLLGTIIKAIERVNSSDGESVYSHSGIIQNEKGKTLEALWRVSEKSFFQEYSGKNVIIARPKADHEKKLLAIDILRRQYLGRMYPFWRLPFHILPPVARFLTWKERWLVCSELVAKFEYQVGCRHDQVTGANPDMLADEWHMWRNFDVIFEGKLP